MHPTATRNEFLRLRVAGLSFAAIARRLGVSKPTLIAWSRKAKPELDACIAEDHQRTLKAVGAEAAQQLADLTRQHHALKQVLLSRAFREVPTAQIETLAGEYHQKIENLKRGADFQSAVTQTPDAPRPDASPSGAPRSDAPRPSDPARSEPIRT